MLLNLLGGILRPASGHVRLGGSDLSTLSRAILSRQMAMVPQETQLAFDYSVLEIARRNEACVTWETSWPSITMLPASMPYNRWSSFSNVRLPEPDSPTSAIFLPARITPEAPAKHTSR